MLTVPRFGIVDLLAATLAVAFGCALWQAPDSTWIDGTIAAIALLAAYATSQESVRLRARGSDLGVLTSHQQFELNFLCWGRIALALVLVGTLAVELLAHHGVVALPEGEDEWKLAGPRSRWGLIWLSLLLSLWDPTRTRAADNPSVVRRMVGALAAIAIVPLLILILSNAAFIHYLVYVAIRGVEAAQSPTSNEGVPTNTRQVEIDLLRTLVQYGLLSLFLIAAIAAINRAWERRPKLRKVLAMVIIAGLLWLAYGVSQFFVTQLRDFSSAMHEGILWQPRHRWVTTLLLLFVVAVAWTYRTVRSHHSNVSPVKITIPDRGTVRAAILLLVFVVLSIIGGIIGYKLATDESWVSLYPTNLLWALENDEYYFAFAVWLASLGGLFTILRRRRSHEELVLHGLPPLKFVTLVILNFALLCFGGAILAWLSFAIWLTRWYALPF